ncbi:hypothetical protein NUW54_g4501 [Trametes sanguinea]|uniref:Uncharacterized protein n=1 Tax=Trametes sanguinea TaxID=158606 RepID=A0ACC1Q183_9APHY|nr:hypothetical protein NUW54_g4501 [Trametes sanguinea]
MANHHPPHPQFLDVDWPHSHEAPPSQSLQLENEYDIDPSRFSILQNDFQPHGDMERQPQQNAGYGANYGRPFGHLPLVFRDRYIRSFEQMQARSSAPGEAVRPPVVP